MKNQKADQRQAQILSFIREKKSVSVIELSQILNVSEETIRRDAKYLEDRGDIVKLHGSLAEPQQVGEAPYEKRMRENVAAKRAISKIATQLVEDGDSLLLETGTTNSIFSLELRSKRGLTVVTNSSDIARNLSVANGNRVYMAGGLLRAENSAAFGPAAVDFVSKFKVKHAFITAAAIHPQHGVMDTEFDEAEFAQAALAIADNRIVLTDSSKFGKSALVKVCGFNKINRLITDAEPPPDLAEQLKRAEVIVNVATTSAQQQNLASAS